MLILINYHANVSVVEFKKWGPSHTHITLTLAANEIPKTLEQIEKIIYVEIPDKDINLLAYETVVQCMLHGPCGAAYPNALCMVARKCSKKDLKRFCDVRTIDEHSFVA